MANITSQQQQNLNRLAQVRDNAKHEFVACRNSFVGADMRVRLIGGVTTTAAGREQEAEWKKQYNSLRSKWIGAIKDFEREKAVIFGNQNIETLVLRQVNAAIAAIEHNYWKPLYEKAAKDWRIESRTRYNAMLDVLSGRIEGIRKGHGEALKNSRFAAAERDWLYAMRQAFFYQRMANQPGTPKPEAGDWASRQEQFALAQLIAIAWPNDTSAVAQPKVVSAPKSRQAVDDRDSNGGQESRPRLSGTRRPSKMDPGTEKIPTSKKTKLGNR